VPLFAGASPVADLGCGRGEFLELLREAGIEGRGVESNPQSVAAGVDAGLDVVHGDLLAFLRGQADGTLGGVFAAQVAEHLPPAVLQGMLREAHRALRPGGLLVLETVNPASAAGFFDVYIRDLTHERPLHPDTLRFLAAAQGFTDARIELRSPVDAASRLLPVPADGLPGAAADALNENIARLNDVLFAPREYALIATR
jgi:O-antigen chain-terminating methyltransferase